MRGKIIQYNGADGSGTIVVDGAQHHFALANWRGDSAPAVNRVVEAVFDGAALTSLSAVADDVLLREKAAELGGKLGASLGKLRAAMPASDGAAAAAVGGGGSAGGASANAILAQYGKPVLITWAVFLIASSMFDAISIGPMSKSMFDLATLMSQAGMGGGGSIKFWLIAAYVGIVIPFFWRDRRAWLALVLPLVAVAWATYSAVHMVSGMGGGYMPDMSELYSIDLGFYLSVLAALVLAALGAKRFLIGSGSGS